MGAEGGLVAAVAGLVAGSSCDDDEAGSGMSGEWSVDEGEGFLSTKYFFRRFAEEDRKWMEADRQRIANARHEEWLEELCNRHPLGGSIVAILEITFILLLCLIMIAPFLAMLWLLLQPFLEAFGVVSGQFSFKALLNWIRPPC
ncbi:MAG: hypothetical protein V1902_00270 [Candidatus Falkowbacteria bacterium]